jgi:hypothetical protein
MMMKIGRLKWMIGVAAVFVLLLSVPATTEAGRRYSGADPILMLDGHKINISVEWPSDHDCNITGPIKIEAVVPKGMGYEFDSESIASHGGCEQQTSTAIVESDDMKDGFLALGAMVPGKRRFEVGVKVKVDGHLVREHKGVSDEWIRGSTIRMSEVDFIDENLETDNNDDDLIYTYDVTDSLEMFYRQSFYSWTYPGASN